MAWRIASPVSIAAPTTTSPSHSAWTSLGRGFVRLLGGGSKVGPRGSRSATQVGDLELDPATLGVWRAGREIRLTAREFALLELLARHPGQVFPRDRLIDALWDADFAAESNIVEVYIRSLRRKVDEGRRDGLIETVRGSGYRLRASGAA